MPDDDDDDVMSEGLGLLTHSVLREVLFSSPQRRMCLFNEPVHLCQGKTSTTPSQAAFTDECLQSHTPEKPAGWKRREEATETVNSHRVWEELRSQNE